MLPRVARAAYPDQPVRVIVPFAAGGNADLVGRLCAEGMKEALGQPFVVDIAPARAEARRRDGGESRPRRLHAVYRLERAAHGQSVRAGEARLRPAEGFRRGRARQCAALRRGARVGAGEDAHRADRDVEDEAGQHRHRGRGQRDAHDAGALQRRDRREVRACALSRRRRAGARSALRQRSPAR